MNAMYLIRPSKPEVDMWAQLLSGDGGNSSTASRWGWDNLYTYMKKAEAVVKEQEKREELRARKAQEKHRSVISIPRSYGYGASPADERGAACYS